MHRAADDEKVKPLITARARNVMSVRQPRVACATHSQFLSHWPRRAWLRAFLRDMQDLVCAQRISSV